MNKSIKKIIAREGLILLGVLLFGLLPVLIIGGLYGHPYARINPITEYIGISCVLLIYAYLGYIVILYIIIGLIIRFINWSIRTLKEK